MEDEVESMGEVEQEKVKLEEELAWVENKNIDLTHILVHASIFSALLTGVEEGGEFLYLDIVPVTREENELLQTGPEFTISITKDVSIYMLNEYNNFYEEEWDYMVNLDRTPLLEMFGDFGRPLFIREASRNTDFTFQSW